MPKRSWSTLDDNQLIHYVNGYINSNQRIKWKLISQKIGKSPSSCFSRYNRILSPDVRFRNNEWTNEEDSTIRSMVKEHYTWTQIKAKLPGRSDLSIFNRWKSLEKKNFDQTRYITAYQPSINELVEVVFAPQSEIPSPTSSTNSSEYSPFNDCFSSSSYSCDSSSCDEDLDHCDASDEGSTPTALSSTSYSSYDHLNYRMDVVFLTNP